MHHRLATARVLAPTAAILMLTCGAEAAMLTAASRSVEAETWWHFRWEPAAGGNAAEATGPAAGFGVFDEQADALAEYPPNPPGTRYTRVVSSQHSDIAPDFIGAEMSMTATSDGFGGTYIGGFSGRSTFHAEFSIDTPTDAVFDAALAKSAYSTNIRGSFTFQRVGGGFSLGHSELDPDTTPIHFGGTLEPGDYVIDAVLDLDFSPWTYSNYLGNTTDSNALALYLTMVPAPGTIGVALCASALGRRRRRG